MQLGCCSTVARDIPGGLRFLYIVRRVGAVLSFHFLGHPLLFAPGYLSLYEFVKATSKWSKTLMFSLNMGVGLTPTLTAAPSSAETPPLTCLRVCVLFLDADVASACQREHIKTK